MLGSVRKLTTPTKLFAACFELLKSLFLSERGYRSLSSGHERHPLGEGSIAHVPGMEAEAAALAQQVIGKPDTATQHPLGRRVAALIDRRIHCPVDGTQHSH